MITAQWLQVPLSLTQGFTLGLAWALLLLADVGWVVLTLGITGNHASSTSVAGFLGGPAFAFAGASFPVFSMPFFAHAWAWLLPTTPHLEMQSSIALMNGTLRDNLAPVGHLVLLIALTLPLGTWLLSRRDRALSQAGAT
jgi:ABC-2 type transport system permease protein